jgi:hypothetical protein
MSSKNYIQYTQVSYSGRDLLSKHSLTETGQWQIRGEDPNCDLGGAHHQPDLGIVDGVLKDVIEYAVELKGFWQWGAGGTITKIKVIQIDTAANQRRAELAAEARAIEARLKEIKSEMGDA